MTIRLLLPYDDYPIGARLSRDLVFETEMVAKNLATFDLTGSFQWPMESADEILGPFSSVATLEMAYPAYRYAGFTSLVGTSAPYAVYFSDGQAWLAKLGGKTNPLTGRIIKNIWVGTQAQYDAIAVKEPNTEYNIIPE